MEVELSQSTYQAFALFLKTNVGIVLGDGRQYLVRSRLASFARNNKYNNLNECLNYVITGKDRALTSQCLELMTTNETFWFRDNYPYQLLTSHLLPALHASRKNLKVWSSACASGQEPYSIAMTIDQYKKQHPKAFPGGINILATDYSSKMISQALSGVFDEMALSRGLDNNYKHQYFESDNNLGAGSMRVTPNIRSMITFKQFNLLNNYTSLGEFDIVFCRNVLIYFDGNQKTKILKKFAAQLPQAGVLMLGAAESIHGAEDVFKMESNNTGLYYRKL